MVDTQVQSVHTVQMQWLATSQVYAQFLTWLREKSDPDLHFSQKTDPDPHQR
jgi:hypothetical protein